MSLPLRQFPETRRAGFTLMELMIAIGILGIGLLMAGSLFPAAIEEANTSYDNTVGIQVAQNGLAVVKACITGDLRPTEGQTTLADFTSKLQPRDQLYNNMTFGSGTDTRVTRLGFKALAAYVRPGLYRIVTVAFRGTATVVNATVSGGTTVGGATLKPGAMLINKSTGEYARVTSILGGVTLDHSITNGAAFAVSGTDVMAAFSTLAGLRPE